MLAVLLLALLGISISGPLTRLSTAAPLAISTWRLGFSLVIVGIALLWTRGWKQWARLSRGDLAVALGAGALLALHFWSWIASLSMTTVAASVLLVDLHPVAVLAGSALLLHEHPTRRQMLGAALGVIGAAIVAGSDVARAFASADRRALLGDALALFGALTVSGYFLTARRLRKTLDLWPYVALVYGACFVVLLALSLATRTTLAPLPPRELSIFAGLAIGPMLLGHTGFNWALKHLPATTVSLAMLGEPVGASLLAFVIPAIGERPGVNVLAGGVVILIGVWMSTGESGQGG